MKLPEYILEIIQKINDIGYEAYVVGGCVRDYLLDRPIHDYDICTSAKPEVILNLFDRSVGTGLKHGTVTVLSDSPVEITTFRLESEYKDHRHPDSVKYVSTIEEDLSRRDFTVNAMAYHPSRGLIDPYGGQVDLKRKIIRCVGNPNRRFNEDALRMLRAYRFCAKLGFSMDETVKKSIDTNATLIQYVSIERIVHELKEIMETNPQVLASMTLLLKPVFNELDLALRCSQNSIYHYTDVLHHTLDAMCYLKPYDETLAFVLLFHDLGKIQVKTTDSNGKDHFKHHAKVGSELSKELCRRFKLTSEQRKWIPFYVLHHDDKFTCDLDCIYKYRVTYHLDEEHLLNLLQIRYCDAMAHSELGQKSAKDVELFYDYYIQNRNRCMSISQLALNGKDIIETTNLRGKQIQEALNMCLKYAFYHPEKNHKIDLIEYIRKELSL